MDDDFFFVSGKKKDVDVFLDCISDLGFQNEYLEKLESSKDIEDPYFSELEKQGFF